MNDESENPMMLGIDTDGNMTVVRYWTANGELMEAKAGGVKNALAALADELGGSGFPVKVHAPEELGGPTRPTEYPEVSVEVVNDKVSPLLDKEDDE